MKTLISINPATNKVIGRVKPTSSTEIKRKVNDAKLASDEWRRLGIHKRLIYVHKAYELFYKRADEIAQLITQEVGTPITECRDEVEWNRSYFEWFMDNAKKYLTPEVVFEDKNLKHTVYYEPLGVAAVITPWNLPFDLFVWGVIPNLLAGNTVVYKAAEECILSGKLYEEIMNKVGLPEGVFSVIHGGPEQGATLANGDIDLIWFTGSSEVGKGLYELAGKKFIKAVLELGGSNPAIIFKDFYDLDLAVNRIFGKRFCFCGQTCDAIKRVFVYKDLYSEVVDKLKSKVAEIIIGDPQNPQTTLGPLVSSKQLNLLETQVQDAIKKGSKIIIGGKRPKNLSGYYYLPTIIENIKPSMRIWKEEVFGPVLTMLPFSTEKEAVSLANDTPYGLGATIFSADNQLISNVVSQIQAGNIEVNGAGHFMPYNPFGGFKASGMGREHGKYGFHELCQLKVISLKKST